MAEFIGDNNLEQLLLEKHLFSKIKLFALLKDKILK